MLYSMLDRVPNDLFFLGRLDDDRRNVLPESVVSFPYIYRKRNSSRQWGLYKPNLRLVIPVRHYPRPVYRVSL